MKSIDSASADITDAQNVLKIQHLEKEMAHTSCPCGMVPREAVPGMLI